jgi:EcoRII C terminal/Restriction endonuclease EcoRII, N-terminal
MASPICELAIEQSLRVGNALLKFISPNDAGITGGHQCGYYLPKAVWEMYAGFGPTKGRNDEAAVSVNWQEDQLTTDSRVKWYGRGTRSEYRLTRFGKGFPFLTPDSVGDLLVLIPENHQNFRAYVLDNDEDIEDIQAALGVEVTGFWAAFSNGRPRVETEGQCIERRFRHFIEGLEDFPTGNAFSQETLEALQECVERFERLNADKTLVQCVDTEYKLYKMAERQICQNEVVRVFRDVDDFLATASSIMNRRKSRAGRSLENHFDYLLRRADIPHVARPLAVDGKPDIIIPSVEAYEDKRYPLNKLFMVGVKTTCKDRWRQVLNEAKRIKEKHILTTQPGISRKQLNDMNEDGVQLIVPKGSHKHYPPGSHMRLLEVEQFIDLVRRRLA